MTRLQACAVKARELLGWEAGASLEDGLRITAAWLEKAGIFDKGY